MSNAMRVVLATSALLAVSWGSEASAQTGLARCQGEAVTVRAQSSGVRTTTVNFNTDQFGNPDPTGYFDPTPLIATDIITTAPTHLPHRPFQRPRGAAGQPRDVPGARRRRPDGGPRDIPVFDPDRSGASRVGPRGNRQEPDTDGGVQLFRLHRARHAPVDVLFAGCCGLTGGVNVISLVRNAVMTLQY